MKRIAKFVRWEKLSLVVHKCDETSTLELKKGSQGKRHKCPVEAGFHRLTC